MNFRLFKDSLKSRLFQYLALAGFALHILFYTSAWHRSHFLTPFFPTNQLHYNHEGLDYYAVPNAAHHFFYKGGTLEGTNGGASGWSESNEYHHKSVYHPIFTIGVGWPMQIFKPEVSFLLWQLVNLFLTLIVIYWLRKKEAGHPYLNFVTFVFLGFFAQYQSIKIAQYQQILNLVLLFFLFYLQERKRVQSYLTMVLSLLIKPAGIFLMPILFLRRHYILSILSFTTFILLTVPFHFWDKTNYFTKHIYERALNMPYPYSDQYSLVSLLQEYFNSTKLQLSALKLLYFSFLSVLAIRKQNSISCLILGSLLGYIYFEYAIFEYHYTIFIPILVFGVLTEKSFQNPISLFLIFIMFLPSVFFVFQLLQIHATPFGDLKPEGWLWVNLSRLMPVSLLFAWIVIIENINWFLEIKQTWKFARHLKSLYQV